MNYYKDHTGEKYGHVEVKKYAGRKYQNGRYYTMWECECECGNVVNIEAQFLSKRKYCCNSCRFKAEDSEKRLSIYRKDFEGKSVSYEKLYAMYQGMKYRCYNSKCASYNRYGGRGIKMCDEWKNSYEEFKKWAYENGFNDEKDAMEQSIDRIDVNGNYEPSNCRFVTWKEQMRNRGNTVYVEYGGKKYPATEFAEKFGITDRSYVYSRVKNNKSGEEILNEWNVLVKTKNMNYKIRESIIRIFDMILEIIYDEIDNCSNVMGISKEKFINLAIVELYKIANEEYKNKTNGR